MPRSRSTGRMTCIRRLRAGQMDVGWNCRRGGERIRNAAAITRITGHGRVESKEAGQVVIDRCRSCRRCVARLHACCRARCLTGEGRHTRPRGTRRMQMRVQWACYSSLARAWRHGGRLLRNLWQRASWWRARTGRQAGCVRHCARNDCGCAGERRRLADRPVEEAGGGTGSWMLLWWWLVERQSRWEQRLYESRPISEGIYVVRLKRNFGTVWGLFEVFMEC